MPKQKALSGGFWVGVSRVGARSQTEPALVGSAIELQGTGSATGTGSLLEAPSQRPNSRRTVFVLGTEWPWQPVVLPGPPGRRGPQAA
jgi:hypothetical protein